MVSFTLQTLAAMLAASAAMVEQCNASPSQPGGPKWESLRHKIKHVVYLMMENRSFDNVAGYWDFHPDIDNLRNRTHCNDYTHPNWTVWGEPIKVCSSPYEDEVPLKDPDHNFGGTSFQIYQEWDPDENSKATMGGFIERQANKYNETPGESAFVIKSFDELKTHLLVTMAKNFAFFDNYHAEHPGPTNVNRMFATSGSSCGTVDNGPQSSTLGSKMPPANCAKSVFEALTEAGISWKNYHEVDIVDGFMYQWVQENAMDRLVTADKFYSDIREGTLPQFAYYNPECCAIDSMHPRSNMAAGESLIKHVYDAIRNSQYWDNVLLVINFDEHGGFADHVVPPTGVPAPDDGLTFDGISDNHVVSYDFTRLGVRVPAFLVSPWIAPNQLVHDRGSMYAQNSAYTHTSVLHFLQQLWGLRGLNNRVQWAKTFEHVFGDEMLDKPETMPSPVWYGQISGPQPPPFYDFVGSTPPKDV